MFIGNHNFNPGGAVAMRGTSRIDVSPSGVCEGVDFQGNSGARGGAIILFGDDEEGWTMDATADGGANMRVSACTFEGNIAEIGHGGAVMATVISTDLELVDGCIFIENHAINDVNEDSDGGAVACGAIADLVSTDSVFEDNTAANGGGTIYFTTFGEGVVTGGSITGGEALKGGGVHATCGGTFLASDLVIAENNSASFGGGISARNGTLSLERVQLRDNRAAGEGGGAAIFKQRLDTIKFLLCELADGHLIITESTVSGNQASSGGGVAARRIASARGSALASHRVWITGSEVSGNTATTSVNGRTSDGIWLQRHARLGSSDSGLIDFRLADSLVEGHAGAGLACEGLGTSQDIQFIATVEDCTFGDNGVGVTAKNSRWRVDHSLFQSAAGDEGVYIEVRNAEEATTFIGNCQFLGGGTRTGIVVGSSADRVSAGQNNFLGFQSGTSRMAVRVDAPGTYPYGTRIDMRTNYWGDSRGPYDPSPDGGVNRNPDGAAVTDGFDYRPYLRALVSSAGPR